MRKVFRNFLAVLGLVVLLSLASAPGLPAEPGDELKSELEALRRQREELERKLKAVKEQEGILERGIEARKNGYYARLEVKGRLDRKVIPPRGVFDDGETIIWTVTAGENTYELFFNNRPSKNDFLALAP